MKKVIIGLLALAMVLPFVSCKKEPEKPKEIKVQLIYPDGAAHSAIAGIEVNLKSTTTDASFKATTDASGIAVFQLMNGLYEVSASDIRTEDGVRTLYNGAVTGIVVSVTTAEGDVIPLNLSASVANQIIIKELYTGGITKESDGKGWANDNYVILYNNSETEVSLENVCFAIVCPWNSTMSSNADIDDATGKHWYAATNETPAGNGIWSFSAGNAPTLPPYGEVVIAIKGAIDNTATYANSVNLGQSGFYAMYDPESTFNNAAAYPQPSANIPTSSYLKGYKYGMGNAWLISANSPGFFIFMAKDGETAESFATSKARDNYYDGKTSPVWLRKMVPNDWVLDALEVYEAGDDSNMKRFTDNIDAGYVNYYKNKGYTVYRNVDALATKAIAENKGKLVYGYTGGTLDVENGTTDPSGIDAEASIKNGAKIIYMDTNNSSQDFHVRKVASIK